jgi:hypothetical protein
MGKTVTIPLKEDQLERLQRLAQRMGKSRSAVGALLLEEALRQAEFPGIEFRDSPVGRQAYMRPIEWVEAAFRYYEAFREEIDAAARAGLTLVTYDQRTIPPLLVSLAEQGLSHGGVIFVNRPISGMSAATWTGPIAWSISALHRSQRADNRRDRVLSHGGCYDRRLCLSVRRIF